MNLFGTILTSAIVTILLVDGAEYAGTYGSKRYDGGHSFAQVCAERGGVVKAYKLCLKPDAVIEIREARDPSNLR